MSPLITYVLLFFIGLYGLITLVDLIFYRAFRRFVIEGIILIAIFVFLNLTTGFPVPQQAFGGSSPLLTIGVMLLCTVLGMAARYIFYQKEDFSWGKFLRPLVISPIILLPLFGTLQGVSDFEPIQILSFAILSFQNGFFWKEMFEKVRKEHASTNTETNK